MSIRIGIAITALYMLTSTWATLLCPLQSCLHCVILLLKPTLLSGEFAHGVINYHLPRLSGGPRSWRRVRLLASDSIRRETNWRTRVHADKSHTPKMISGWCARRPSVRFGKYIFFPPHDRRLAILASMSMFVGGVSPLWSCGRTCRAVRHKARSGHDARDWIIPFWVVSRVLNTTCSGWLSGTSH